MIRLLTLLILTCIPNIHTRATMIVRVDSGVEEYAVYSALLNKKYITDRTKLIIIDQTLADPFFKEFDRDEIGRLLSPVSMATVDAFKEINKEHHALKGRLDLKVKYDFLGDREWRQFFKEDVVRGWDEFYKNYPEATGYIRLSGVGFNPERTEAVVFVMHGCGAMCGTGTFVRLIKGKEGWRIALALTVMVS